MPWFISVAFAVIICGVAFLIGRAMRREAEPGSPESDRGMIVAVAAVIVFVLWVGAHTALTALKPIEAGSVGVVYQFGEIVGQRGEGLQFIAPWQELRTESIKVQRKRFDNISGFSRETQDVIVSTTLNYRVDPAAVQDLYRTVGPNWFDTLVEPRINQFFKAETVKYNTVDIAPNREQIRLDVRTKLDENLRQFSITVEDLLIENIQFTPEFQQSIDEKQIAAQNALRETERIEQARSEAQQVEERAKGRRAEVEELAAGDAEARRLRAQGEADAIRLLAAAYRELNTSLTPEILQYFAVDKLSPNVSIALIPSGQGVIIDPATLLEQLQTETVESEGEPAATATTAATAAAAAAN